ncbi:MAG: ORF6N domain-containing protein [Terriglobales bacterium]
MNKSTALLTKRVDDKIRFLRGQKVILDVDLAELYCVSVKRLNEQVRRNRARFPRDFLFRLTRVEFESLRSQFATSNNRRGGRRYLPYAFTEHGAIMAATVLNSERAIQMSIFVVRAFAQMREALAANQQIMAKLVELERRIEGHDANIEDLVEAIRELMAPPAPNRRKIGFETTHRAGGTNGKVISVVRASHRAAFSD